MKTLAIIVPTKNRQAYLSKICEQFSDIDDERLKLYIHDNSDNLDFKMKKLDNRIHYRHTNDKINMHENFKLAYQQVADDVDYVIFLGDDDFVTPRVSSLLDILETNEYDCVVPDLAIRYWWPDVTHRYYADSLSGQLRIPKRNKGEIYFKKIETKKSLKECFDVGGVDIRMLPKLYHGVVSKNILDKIYADGRDLFNGPTPDMASAVTLCFELVHYHRTNLPFLVSGTAASSGGGAGVRKEHLWSLDQTPWFDKKYLKRWNCKTPPYACGATLWSEGLMQVSMDYGYIQEVNFSRLYAKCIHESKLMINPIKRIINKNNNFFNYIGKILSIFWFWLLFFKERAFALIENILIAKFNYSSKYHVHKNIQSPLDINKMIRNED